MKSHSNAKLKIPQFKGSFFYKIDNKLDHYKFKFLCYSGDLILKTRKSSHKIVTFRSVA